MAGFRIGRKDPTPFLVFPPRLQRFHYPITHGNVAAGTRRFTARDEDCSTLPITNTGYTYDAAGDLTSDGIHGYSYDADGNLVQVDGGSTAQYVYNAFNQRVEIEAGGDGSEFTFNLNGQRTSIWDANSGNNIQGQSYWGSVPLEFYSGGSAH